MSKKQEWDEDTEVASIAMEIVELARTQEFIDKHGELFGTDLDVGKIQFIRVKNRQNGKLCKVTAVTFPFSIDINHCLYYIEIDDVKWKKMTEAKRNFTVLRALFEIMPGGMDAESANYCKKRKKDIDDYSELINLTGGRYDWSNEDSNDIVDILSAENAVTDEDKKNIDELMKE